MCISIACELEPVSTASKRLWEGVFVKDLKVVCVLDVQADANSLGAQKGSSVGGRLETPEES